MCISTFKKVKSLNKVFLKKECKQNLQSKVVLPLISLRTDVCLFVYEQTYTSVSRAPSILASFCHDLRSVTTLFILILGQLPHYLLDSDFFKLPEICF